MCDATREPPPDIFLTLVKSFSKHKFEIYGASTASGTHVGNFCFPILLILNFDTGQEWEGGEDGERLKKG